jgi:steroid delta-isomerase-like uncharacterized protein
MAHDAAQLVSDLLAAWNAHDPERAAAFYAPNYVGTDVGHASPQHGPRGRMVVLRSYIRAFPDLRFEGEVLVDGERAVLLWTMHGTHRGTIMHIPPTGRKVAVRGVSVLTIADGLITHGETIWDTAGFLRALGLLPEL